MSDTQFPITFDTAFSENLANPVNQVTELLRQTDSSDYVGTKPEIIEDVWERTPQARINESRDAVYVWQPVDGEIERVTADGDLLFRENTVEVWVYVLEDKKRAVQLRNDILQFFTKFIDDNKANTQFNDIQPVNDMDNRPGNLPRDSSHDVMGLTLELNKRQSVA